MKAVKINVKMNCLNVGEKVQEINNILENEFSTDQSKNGIYILFGDKYDFEIKITDHTIYISDYVKKAF